MRDTCRTRPFVVKSLLRKAIQQTVTRAQRSGGTSFTVFVSDAAPEPSRIRLLRTLCESLDDAAPPTVGISRDQLECWADGPLTDDQVARIDACIPQSSVPDAVAEIAAQFPAGADPAGC